MSQECLECGAKIVEFFEGTQCPQCDALLDSSQNVSKSDQQFDENLSSPSGDFEEYGESLDEGESFKEERSSSNEDHEDSDNPPPSYSSAEQDSDLDDIEEFANSEESSAREGEFFYDVTVSHIDSEELRLALKDAITDSKFVWDVNNIMNSIKDGTVIIKHINPVKASVLIQRIKNEPFKIHWEQSSIYKD